MTIGRFWVVLPVPRFTKPRYGRMPDGSWYFHWGGFSVGMWSREKWARRG